MKEYDKADFLPLPGLQHFIFCRRQFALIHIKQQWRENLRAAEARLLHENAHDGGLLVSRALPVFSRTLGVRAQNSVFECVLDAATERMLRHQLTGLIDPECDSLRFYRMGNKDRQKAEHIGAKPAIDVAQSLIV